TGTCGYRAGASRSVLEQPKYILGQWSVKPLLHSKPALALARNPQLPCVGPERHEPGPRFPGTRQDDLLASRRSLDELWKVSLGLGDVDDPGHDVTIAE